MMLGVLVLFCGLFRTTDAAARRDMKTWGRMSDRAWQKAEKEWEDGDDEDELEDDQLKKVHGHVEPKFKTEMAFVSLPDSYTKVDTDRVAGVWTELLRTGAVEAVPYPIEVNKVLFTTSLGLKHMLKIQKFVLAQPQTVTFTWNSQDTHGPAYAANEEWKTKNGKSDDKKDKDKTEKKKKTLKTQEL